MKTKYDTSERVLIEVEVEGISIQGESITYGVRTTKAKDSWGTVFLHIDEEDIISKAQQNKLLKRDN